MPKEQLSRPRFYLGCTMVMSYNWGPIRHDQTSSGGPNSAAKLLFRLSKQSSASGLLHDLHWLTVDKRINFKALCFMHKINSNSGPWFLQKGVIPYRPPCSLCSRYRSLFRVPRVRLTQMGGRSFSFLGIHCRMLSLNLLEAAPPCLPFARSKKNLVF